MSPHDYRNRGWTVGFQAGKVYLWKPGSPVVSQQTAGGRWMNRPDGWESDSERHIGWLREVRGLCCCDVRRDRTCKDCKSSEARNTAVFA